MFGIGGFELFLILLFGFLIFGPDKLPAMAKTLGKAINKFRTAQQEMSQVIKTEVYNPDSDEPFKNPLDVMEKTAKAGKDAVKKTAGSSSTASAAAKPAGTAAPKQESFSERKARYDRERAAKQKADEEKRKAQAAVAATAANTAAKKVEAATDGAPAAQSTPAASATPSSTPAESNEKGE